jgi:hypothetical protein
MWSTANERAPYFVAALIAVFACHPVESIPAPPLSPEAKSGLLISTGSSPTVVAFNVAAGLPRLYTKNAGDLAILEFGCTLDRLGLEPGPQKLLAMPSDKIRLPRPKAVWLATASENATWSNGQLPASLDEFVRRLELDDENICRSTIARFRTQQIALPQDGRNDPGFVIRTDDDHALVSSRNGYYYLVDREGNAEKVTDFGDKQYVAGYRAPDGELWLMSLDGETVRGRLGAGFTAVTSTAPLERSERIWLEGSHGDAPFELYAETDSRAFLRLEGSTWQLIERSRQHDGVFRPDLVWTGPNEAVAIGVGDVRNTVVKYANGTVMQDVLPENSGLSSIAFTPELGLIVGRDNGAIWHKNGDSPWKPLPSSGRELHYVRAITPISNGFFYGAGFEINFLEYHFFQYYPGVGHCPPERLTEYATTHLTELSGGVYIMASLASFDAPLALTRVTTEEPANSCEGL